MMIRTAYIAITILILGTFTRVDAQEIQEERGKQINQTVSLDSKIPEIIIIADPNTLTDAKSSVPKGRDQISVGQAASASTGVVGNDELITRPLLRPGELLETVPGLVVTQHSGTGKANQYFLRGFNLDHGTDFRTEVEGTPINMPTHGHGQGYTDLNFIIPELVESIEYKKGVYYAEEGDFSSAGAADFVLARKLEHDLARVEIGDYGYQRALAAQSHSNGDKTILTAVELSRYDGPWELEQRAKKINLMLRYTKGDRFENHSLMFLGYHSTWRSTDQIPERAVDSGLISRFGNLDESDGGEAGRYAVSYNYTRETDLLKNKADVYFVFSDLSLFSNFTYFLDDPENGDQFEQVDQRKIFGTNLSHSQTNYWETREIKSEVGFQLRNDSIPEVGLFKTRNRERLSTTRDDDVFESTAGIYGKSEIKWAKKFRSIAGLRADAFYFDVNSNIQENSGDDFDGLISPKGSLIFGPWAKTEIYLNGGLGFHSNDARGTTITVDPVSRERAEKVDPLVRSEGAELGVRTEAYPGLSSTISLWALNLDSELLFIGDAGITEPSRKSLRRGIEFSNYWKVSQRFAFDADISLSHAEFDDEDPAGDNIPGAIERTFTAGATAFFSEELFSTLRFRYLGPRALIEDDSVKSNSTTLVNLSTGYKKGQIRLNAEVLNLFDSNDHDIDYFYSSRLPGELATDGVEDIHFHPVEPRTFRLSATYLF